MSAQELAFMGLAGSGVGTALSMPMVWPRVARTLDVRLLGLAVLLMSMVSALISARLAGLTPPSGPVDHAINLLGMSAVPLLVLYSRHATALPISAAHAAWWAPAIGYAVVMAVRGPDARVPFLWLLPIMCTFTAASVVTLWRTGIRRSTVVPAQWVVAFCVLLNVAQVIRMEFGHVATIRALVPLVTSIGFVALAVFAAWRIAAAVSADRDEDPAARYERSTLDDAQARELLSRIDRALTDKRLFARPDLSLAGLAMAASATPHQVSEVLNRHAGVSFHDLINRRRVDDVKAQLLDPGSDRFTIEGIGASAGFGSRSALYTAFKRLEGQTPTQFRASRRANAS